MTYVHVGFKVEELYGIFTGIADSQKGVKKKFVEAFNT